jgi:aminoglycoside-2''-adenylyltransferase
VTAIEPDVSKWDAWRPDEVARLLEGVQVPWYVAAGWAIELFLGDEGRGREHEDLEIAVPNTRFDEVAEALGGFEIFVITDRAEATPLASARDRLMDTHQTWIRDPAGGEWRLDVFREPSDGDTWICRRDPAIRMPYERLIERTADGIPYGRPEVVLLFKAKHAHMEKNERDFEAVLPHLDAERRAWLRDALERVHSAHAWLGEL